MARTVLFGIKLQGESKGFEKLGAAVQSVNQGIELVSKGVALVKTVTIDAAKAIFDFAQASANMSDAVMEAGQLTGTSSEFISQLGFAARQSGVDVKVMEGGLVALTRRISAMPEVFKKWGIAVKDSDGKLRSTDVVLRDVADKTKNLGSAASRAAFAQDLMSEAGRQLVPLLVQGSEGIDRFAKEADKLGITVSTTSALIAGEFNNEIGRARDSTNALARVVGGFLLPLLTSAAKEFNKLSGETLKWFKANEKLIDGGLTTFLLFVADVGVPAVATGFKLLSEIVAGFASIIPFVTLAFNRMWQAIFKGAANSVKSLELAAKAMGATGLGQAAELARRAIESIGIQFKKSGDDSKAELLAINATIQSMEAALLALSEGSSAAIRRVIIAAKALKEALKGVKDETNEADSDAEAAFAESLRKFNMQLADAETLAAERKLLREVELAGLERVASANERAAERMRTGFEQANAAILTTFRAVTQRGLTTAQRVAAGFQSMFSIIGKSALKALQDQLIADAIQRSSQKVNIVANAAEGATKAAKEQAGLGPFGFLAAFAILPLVFGVISAFANRFQFGGEVVPNVVGAPAGRDVFPALLRAGETVTPANQEPEGGGPMSVTFQQINNTLFAPNEQQIDEANRDQLFRSTERLRELGFEVS